MLKNRFNLEKEESEMKKIPCTLLVNAPRTGHVFTPQQCESIAEAERKAAIWGFPYRIIGADGKLIKTGWKQAD